ncbi:MAG: hypothetical protein ACTJFR_03880 [Canibacter sp.]
MSANQATGHRKQQISGRLAWLIPGGIALLLGLDAGLLLLGLPAPLTFKRLPEVHGMLLTLGTVATLVSLERAAALGRWYGYFAPALLGVSGLALIVDPLPISYAKIGLAVGCAAFMFLYVPLWRRQHDATVLTQLLGAALALAGSIIWISDVQFSHVVPWLIGFLVLTIAAERVELARITMGPNSSTVLLAHAWAMTVALIVGVVHSDTGAALLGLVLLSLVAWLIRHDIARRTIKSTGVIRYMAACILVGYLWLTVAAVVLLFGAPESQTAYDAVIHAVFLGYTFSMIMAHATTILPAVLRIPLPYRPAFWAPAALLQVALIVRLWLGDAFTLPWAWQLGGVLGIAALLLFIVIAVTSAVLGPPAKKPGTSAAATSRAPHTRETRQ